MISGHTHGNLHYLFDFAQEKTYLSTDTIPLSMMIQAKNIERKEDTNDYIQHYSFLYEHPGQANLPVFLREEIGMMGHSG